MFGAGFVLGAIRVTLIVPRLGVRAAELLEMPIMLVVIAFAARWVVRRFVLPETVGPRWRLGLFALGLLLAAELSLDALFTGRSLAEYVASRDPVSGGVYLLMLFVFAAMPALMRPRP